MFLHQRLGFFSSSKEMLEQAGRKHLIAVKLQKQLNCCFKKKKKSWISALNWQAKEITSTAVLKNSKWPNKSLWLMHFIENFTKWMPFGSLSWLLPGVQYWVNFPAAVDPCWTHFLLTQKATSWIWGWGRMTMICVSRYFLTCAAALKLSKHQPKESKLRKSRVHTTSKKKHLYPFLW